MLGGGCAPLRVSAGAALRNFRILAPSLSSRPCSRMSQIVAVQIPVGCPPGGQYLMVKYMGPATQQAQSSHSTFCCILGILCGNPICCLCAACPPPDLKDEKEVYQVGGTYYTLNGTVDTNVGPAGPPAPMPPVPIDVDPATAARLAELINRGVGVWTAFL